MSGSPRFHKTTLNFELLTSVGEPNVRAIPKRPTAASAAKHLRKIAGPDCLKRRGTERENEPNIFKARWRRPSNTHKSVRGKLVPSSPLIFYSSLFC